MHNAHALEKAVSRSALFIAALAIVGFAAVRHASAQGQGVGVEVTQASSSPGATSSPGTTTSTTTGTTTRTTTTTGTTATTGATTGTAATTGATGTTGVTGATGTTSGATTGTPGGGLLPKTGLGIAYMVVIALALIVFGTSLVQATGRHRSD